MNLLFGHDKAVADWASQQFGSPLRNWYFAIGLIDNEGLLRGAASFHDFNGSNIEICFYGPGAMTPSAVRGLMKFAFVELKANRITARTPRQNKAVIRALPKFGFRCEGVAKRYFGATKRLDAIMFGLLKADAQKHIERAA